MRENRTIVRVEHRRALSSLPELAQLLFARKSRKHLIQEHSDKHDDERRGSGQGSNGVRVPRGKIAGTVVPAVESRPRPIEGTGQAGTP